MIFFFFLIRSPLTLSGANPSRKPMNLGCILKTLRSVHFSLSREAHKNARCLQTATKLCFVLDYYSGVPFPSRQVNCIAPPGGGEFLDSPNTAQYRIICLSSPLQSPEVSSIAKGVFELSLVHRSMTRIFISKVAEGCKVIRSPFCLFLKSYSNPAFIGL